MRNLTIKQLKKICQNNKYILLRTDNMRLIGYNTALKDISIRKHKPKGTDFTSFVSWQPCDFQTYISYKVGYI